MRPNMTFRAQGPTVYGESFAPVWALLQQLPTAFGSRDLRVDAWTVFEYSSCSAWSGRAPHLMEDFDGGTDGCLDG